MCLLSYILISAGLFCKLNLSLFDLKHDLLEATLDQYTYKLLCYYNIYNTVTAVQGQAL